MDDYRVYQALRSDSCPGRVRYASLNLATSVGGELCSRRKLFFSLSPLPARLCCALLLQQRRTPTPNSRVTRLSQPPCSVESWCSIWVRLTRPRWKKYRRAYSRLDIDRGSRRPTTKGKSIT